MTKTTITEPHSYESITKLIAGWHHDRNLIEGCKTVSQFTKLTEEYGELAANLCRGKCVQDDIGDMMVVLVNLAAREGVTLMQCLLLSSRQAVINNIDECFLGVTIGIGDLAKSVLAGTEMKGHIGEILFSLQELASLSGHTSLQCLLVAWKEIEHRKGRMIDGFFVKEEDLWTI